MARHGLRSLAVSTVAVVLGASAVFWGARGIEGGREAQTARAVNTALNGGPHANWAAAVAVVRRGQRDASDGDAQAGSLLLRSLADPHPASRPVGTVEDGWRLMERGASAHPARDAPVIESVLRYGVSEPHSDHIVLPPHRPAADCWARVEVHTEPPQTCIDLRQRNAAPKA